MKTLKVVSFFFFVLLSTWGFGQNKNVLFIIVDDLKPTLNSFGESQIISPNIDALAASGVAFTNAHAQQAVCAPSRVSFMTGMRPDHTKVWDLKTKMRDMQPDILTMPQYFKKNGYATLGLGKVLHGARKNDARSWTKDFVEDTDLAYAKGYPMPANKDYQSEQAQALYSKLAKKYPGDPNSDKVRLAVNKEFKKLGVRRSTEMADVPDDAYSDGAIALRSIKEMEQFQKGKKPFFLTVGFHKPHLPFVAPKKYWDLYDRDKIQLAPFQEQAEGSPDFAMHTFGELKNYSDIQEALDEKGRVIESKQRELIHGYYASVSYVDAQVGLLMDYLEESGLKDNTLVVLIGDHGWHLGDHGLWNKHSNFEQATRTPMIIAGAGVKKGIKNGSPVELVDVFPTICDFTGQKIPGHLEGSSLGPVLSGDEESVKEFALSQYPRHGDRMGYAVRSGRHRYVAWFKGDFENRTSYDESQLIAEEMYDYETDPLETKSFHDDSEYSAIKAEMKKWLIAKVWNNSKGTTPEVSTSLKISDRITYKKVDTVSLELWLYFPEDYDPSKQYPTILFFHGGGWNSGSPKAFNRHSKYFASRGMIAFSVEYRIKNTHGTTPFDATEDAKDAFDFVVENANELGVDVSKLVVSGGSAGGHLATTTSFWKNDGVQPAGLILFNPVLDIGPEGFAHRRVKTHYKEYDPMVNIHNQSPPTLVLVGTKDKVLPVETANKYRAKTTELGRTCKIKFYEDQEHSFFNRPPFYQDTVIESDQFMIDLGILTGKPTMKPAK